MRRARDESERVGRRGGAEADEADEGVGAALRERRARAQPEVRRRLLREPAAPRAHRDAPPRPFGREIVETEPLEQRERPAFEGGVGVERGVARAHAVAVPPRRHVAPARHQLARALPLQPVLALADCRGASPRIGLALLQPEGLAQHPLGREGALAVAVHRQRRLALATLQDLRRLRRRSAVHPQQRRPERLAVGVEGHDRARGGGDAERCDLVRGQR